MACLIRLYPVNSYEYGVRVRVNKDFHLREGVISGTILNTKYLCTVKAESLLSHVSSPPAGAIFDSRDIESQKAFEYGIIRHRQSPQREPYFKFNVTMDTVDTADTFQVASASK